MERWSVGRTLLRFFSALGIKAHEEREVDSLEAYVEAPKETAKKMESYKSMCLCGITSMYWKDSNALLKKLSDYNKTLGSVGSVYITVGLVSMMLGLTASTFPMTAPHARAISAHGGLQAVLFMISSVHLEIFEFYPKHLVFTSWGLACGLSILYWSLSAQEPKLLFLVARPLYWISLPFYILGYVVLKLWKPLWRKDERVRVLPVTDARRPIHGRLGRAPAPLLPQGPRSQMLKHEEAVQSSEVLGLRRGSRVRWPVDRLDL